MTLPDSTPKAYCPDHGSPLPPACAECEAVLQRPIESMTADERADELQHWFDIVLTVQFSKLHERIELLVGRPVWTHEMASSTCDNLVREARSQEHPVDLEAHVIGSLDQLAGNKPVVIVRPE